MRRSIIFGCVSCLAAVVGCSPSSGGAPDAGGQEASSTFDAGGGGSEAGADASAEASSGRDGSTNGGADAAMETGSGDSAGCTLPSTITASMTLDTSCNPWIVPSGGTTVAGTGSPVLTIDSGVTVAFDPGGYLAIGDGGAGGLHAVGTSGAHITFTASTAGPQAGNWNAVEIMDNTLAGSTIAYADFDYGAGTSGATGSYQGPPGALVVDSSTTTFEIALHDLTFKNNQGNGLVMYGTDVGFAAGSGNLSVSDWGTGYHPFVVAANVIGNSPGGLSTGLPTTLTAPATSNGSPAVVDVVGGDGQGGGTNGQAVVQVTQTWPAIGLPYLVDGDREGSGSGMQIEGTGTTSATLTIAAPNTLQFLAQGSLQVDPFGSGLANLVATGNITFTAASASPSPGIWYGISFLLQNGGLPNSTLSGVTIDWAGGFYSSNDSSGNTFYGPVWLNGPVLGSVAGPTITGCTFLNVPTNPQNCAIVATGVSASSLSSYSSNTYGGTKACGT